MQTPSISYVIDLLLYYHFSYFPSYIYFIHFFLSRIRLPPKSPLFPYTTLFRSWSPSGSTTSTSTGSTGPPSARIANGGPRSEEHTSELQSPYDLVCRLLLEKKNNSVLFIFLLLSQFSV